MKISAFCFIDSVEELGLALVSLRILTVVSHLNETDNETNETNNGLYFFLFCSYLAELCVKETDDS